MCIDSGSSVAPEQIWGVCVCVCVYYTHPYLSQSVVNVGICTYVELERVGVPFLHVQVNKKIWSPFLLFIISSQKKEKYPPCVCTFLALSLAVFWHRVTWPYQEGAGGLGSCLPRPLRGLNATFESSFFSLTDKRQGERSHRTQPSSVKQFQLWPLVNFFFFLG